MADDVPRATEAPPADPAQPEDELRIPDAHPPAEVGLADEGSAHPPAEVPPPDEAPTREARGRDRWAAQGRREASDVVPFGVSRARSASSQKGLIFVAFAAPCAVIALSLFFILHAGEERPALPSGLAAVRAQPAPSSAPSQFPGETEVDDAPAELSEPVSEAGPSLEQPSQLVPELTPPMAALPGFEDETGDELPAPTKPAPPKHFATVQDAAAGSCSTESVDGLSRQIIDQARCMKPNEFVPLPKRANLLMAPSVYPYLELGARDHLLRALDAHKSATMTINSALRTVAQQYLVSHWSLSKTCGVQLATRPGESNHEIGTALDIKEAASWRPALEAQDFKWLGASDRVHFDYKSASPTRTATDVLAFQKLWNRNHKDDAIAESGRFDAATEQRLKKSPPSGFSLGASCGKARPR